MQWGCSKRSYGSSVTGIKCGFKGNVLSFRMLKMELWSTPTAYGYSQTVRFWTFLSLFFSVVIKLENQTDLNLCQGEKTIKRVREKSRECHNCKPQAFPDTKRKRKPTYPNKHKSNKRTRSTKISSLFPKRGNRNAIMTEKHKNKMTQGNT